MTTKVNGSGISKLNDKGILLLLLLLGFAVIAVAAASEKEVAVSCCCCCCPACIISVVTFLLLSLFLFCSELPIFESIVAESILLLPPPSRFKLEDDTVVECIDDEKEVCCGDWKFELCFIFIFIIVVVVVVVVEEGMIKKGDGADD